MYYIGDRAPKEETLSEVPLKPEIYDPKSLVAKLAVLRKYAAAPPPEDTVRCPAHMTFMKYVAEYDMLLCPDDGCGKAARRHVRFDPSFGIPDDVQAYAGSYQLCQSVEGRYYIYMADVNKLIDVTAMIVEGAEELTRRPTS